MGAGPSMTTVWVRDYDTSDDFGSLELTGGEYAAMARRSSIGLVLNNTQYHFTVHGSTVVDGVSILWVSKL